MNPILLGAVEPEAAPIAIGAWCVGMLFFWLWWSRLRFARLLRDVPSTPIRGVFVGLVETTGRVEHDDPLIAPLSQTPCVQYGWSVREHWRRTQTYRDSKGKTQTRIVTGSDIVAAGGAEVDLRLRDETGAIIVRVNGASWTTKDTFSRTATLGDSLYHTQAPNRVVPGSTGRRNFSESSVPIGSTAWVMGNARIRPDGQALEIGSGGEEGVFMISLSGEGTHSFIARGLAITGLVLGTGCAIGAGIALGGLARQMLPGLTEPQTALLPVVASAALWFLLITVMWSFIVRNGAVRVRTRWERAASLVDVELRRRADLVPNLVVVTRASAAHESSIQRAVAELRAGAASEGIFRILSEHYPTLTADASFLLLQQQLTETESRIAQARIFEIQSRERLLERLQSFPEGLIARIMGVAHPPPALASPAPRSSSPEHRSPS